MVSDPPRVRTRRDEAAEELERALNESLQPDFLAEIIAAESRMQQLSIAPQEPVSPTRAPEEDGILGRLLVDDEDDVDTTETVAYEANVPDDVDLNAEVPICNLPERMILIMLEYLDEDSIGLFSSVCHRFHATARSDSIWSMMCHRVFSIQSLAGSVQLRKYKSWMHMFVARPRVKYHGYYVLRITYYKKPELSMWTDLPAGTVLQAIYYRYFNFKRNGTVLYCMTHRHPREMFEGFRRPHKEIHLGSYYVSKGEVYVVVNVGHSILQFIFRLASRWRAPNTRLILISHAQFHLSDVNLRHPHYFDTAEEEFNFRRHWPL
ncbi:hypothetical protein AC1031_003347 [Aphanomyces cochlioides]|nr:hypothetical protein AC1031_003347 [Aphanomyces cochlioides]